MSDSNTLRETTAEIVRIVVDPTSHPVVKTTAAVTAATGWLGQWAATLTAVYMLVCIVIALPKLWNSIKWWFGQDRRRPDYLADDQLAPRRRFNDPRD